MSRKSTRNEAASADVGVAAVLPTYSRDGVLLACWGDSKPRAIVQFLGFRTECLVSKWPKFGLVK